MSKFRFFSHISYLVVGFLSLLFAVFLATRFMQKGYSLERTPNQQATPAENVSGAGAQQPERPSTAPVQMNTSLEENSQISNNNESRSKENTEIAEGAFLEPYVFDTREGRRNPFRPPNLGEGLIADIMLPGTPLERFELEELRLVGIMWDIKSPKAMIIDPQGDVHVIGKDDRVGRKRGYVATIREGEVVVVEVSNFNGEDTYSTRILRVDK